MRRTFKYGHFVGMSPVCGSRVREYPDLEPIAEAYRNGRSLDGFHSGDLEDAQHQWVTSYGADGCRSVPMQRCWEAGCSAVRPAPLRDYPENLQAQILQLEIKRMREKI